MCITRRRALALVLMAAGGIALAIWLLPTSSINERSYDRIRDGMSLADVEQVLNGPARDESSGPLLAYTTDDDIADKRGAEFAKAKVGLFRGKFEFFDRGANEPIRVTQPRFWITDSVIVRIDFDHEDRVIAKQCMRVRPEGGFDLIRMLCRWLRI